MGEGNGLWCVRVVVEGVEPRLEVVVFDAPARVDVGFGAGKYVRLTRDAIITFSVRFSERTVGRLVGESGHRHMMRLGSEAR